MKRYQSIQKEENNNYNLDKEILYLEKQIEKLRQENKIAKNKIKPKYKLEKNKNNQILIVNKEEIQKNKTPEKGKQKKKGTIYD